MDTMQFFLIILGVVLAIVVILVCRAVTLWYFRIDDICLRLDKIVAALEAQNGKPAAPTAQKPTAPAAPEAVKK